jgi:hypothetical protein
METIQTHIFESELINFSAYGIEPLTCHVLTQPGTTKAPRASKRSLCSREPTSVDRHVHKKLVRPTASSNAAHAHTITTERLQRSRAEVRGYIGSEVGAWVMDLIRDAALQDLHRHKTACIWKLRDGEFPITDLRDRIP